MPIIRKIRKEDGKYIIVTDFPTEEKETVLIAFQFHRGSTKAFYTFSFLHFITLLYLLISISVPSFPFQFFLDLYLEFIFFLESRVIIIFLSSFEKTGFWQLLYKEYGLRATRYPPTTQGLRTFTIKLGKSKKIWKYFCS